MASTAPARRRHPVTPRARKASITLGRAAARDVLMDPCGAGRGAAGADMTVTTKMTRLMLLGLAGGMLSCAGGSTGRGRSTRTSQAHARSHLRPAPAAAMPALPRRPAAHAAAIRPEQPGQALLASERAVWTLEGRLLLEADAMLRTPAARSALGDPALLAFSDAAEARVRSYLRAGHSAAVRTLAQSFVASLDRPSRALLAGAAGAGAPEDVVMDYLTYDGLYDLALMRYGHRQWRAGRYARRAASQALAQSFFAQAGSQPGALRGIQLGSNADTASRDGALDVTLFGATIQQRVLSSLVTREAAVGWVGVVRWSSNYEQLRRLSRGEPLRAEHEERVAYEDGGFHISYAAELDEYLRLGAATRWASLLYTLPADEVADLYAGAAASGGLTAGAARQLEPRKLPRYGRIGSKQAGFTVRVQYVHEAATLAGVKPRAGKFVRVNIELHSKWSRELRAPADWFTLVADDTSYPEVAVSNPGMAPLLVALGGGARPLGMPLTRVAARRDVRLTLVYDVPVATREAALVIGADELALRVSLGGGAR